MVAQPPAAADPVAAWLTPATAGRLEAAGIFTLAQLIDRVNGLGSGWTASVRGVGQVKGERVLEWLRSNEDAIGMRIGRHVAHRRRELTRQDLAQVVAPAADIRPLEKLIVPAELDGRHGEFRRPQAQCLIGASNDYAAVIAWLQSKAGLTPEQRATAKARRRGGDSAVDSPDDALSLLSHTQRAYRKEAERFLLWAIVERRKALSSMTTEDCIAYRQFITDPQPRSRW